MTNESLVRPELPPAIYGTLGETLRLNAMHFGESIGVSSATRTVTHTELYLRGHRLAAGWRALGLTRKDRVAMLAMNCVEVCELYAASEISGIPIVPMNFRLGPSEHLAIIRDSEPKTIFFESGYAEVVDFFRKDVPSIRHFVCIGTSPEWVMEFEPFMAASQPAMSWPSFSPDSLSCILYTSGTTGSPKGCMHSHRGFLKLGELMTAKMGLTASDRGLIMMPLFHMGGKSVQLGLHWSGGELFIHRKFEVEDILQTIARERITVTHMAPSMIQALLDHPAVTSFDFSSLRVIFYSAAAMPEPLLRRGLEKLGPVFIQSYGQTEVTGTVLPAKCHLPDGGETSPRHLSSVGIAPRGVEVMVTDENDLECPSGTAGEIKIKSPASMIGYWNNPTATLETMHDGWIRTGDIGIQDQEGFIYLVDRKKDVIISGGENIYSREVENAIYSHPDVIEVAVIGVPDHTWGEAVCAIVVRNQGSRLDEAILIDHCRKLIASYKKPKQVVFLDSLPKLASGKIDKKALRQIYSKYNN
jgi:acyl-CoA synthetase (AMP-forming)/AMP-acid ligase II